MPKQAKPLVRCILPLRQLERGGQAVKQTPLTAPEMWGGILGWASPSQTAQHGFGVSVMGHLLSIIVPGHLLSNRKWKQAKSTAPPQLALASKFHLQDLPGTSRKHGGPGDPDVLPTAKTSRPPPVHRGDVPSQCSWPGGPTHKDKQCQVATPLPTEPHGAPAACCSWLAQSC